MAERLQLVKLSIAQDCTLSFNLLAGEIKVINLPTAEAKSAFIEMLLGEVLTASGVILLNGKSLDAVSLGDVGFVPEAGGLISNLKAWENVTLPLWYHSRRNPLAAEEMVARWLDELKLPQSEWQRFMASPISLLKPYERKLAGLLRGLILAPQLLLIDAAIFENIEKSAADIWVKAVEKYANAADAGAVLVVSVLDTALPWDVIK